MTLFHGTRDELIPFGHSEYLQGLIKGQAQLVSLPNTGHRGAIFSDVLRRELSSILK